MSATVHRRAADRPPGTRGVVDDRQRELRSSGGVDTQGVLEDQSSSGCAEGRRQAEDDGLNERDGRTGVLGNGPEQDRRHGKRERPARPRVRHESAAEASRLLLTDEARPNTSARVSTTVSRRSSSAFARRSSR